MRKRSNGKTIPYQQKLRSECSIFYPHTTFSLLKLPQSDIQILLHKDNAPLTIIKQTIRHLENKIPMFRRDIYCESPSVHSHIKYTKLPVILKAHYRRCLVKIMFYSANPMVVYLICESVRFGCLRTKNPQYILLNVANVYIFDGGGIYLLRMWYKRIHIRF